MEEKIIGILLDMQKDISDLKNEIVITNQKIDKVEENLKEDMKIMEQGIRKDMKKMEQSIRKDMKIIEENLRQEIKFVDEKLSKQIEQLSDQIEELRKQRYIDSHNIAKILEYQIEMNKHYA